jgi:hypothetical protein
MGRIQEAREMIRKAAILNPASAAQNFYNLGATLKNARNMAQAADAFRQAIAADVKFAEAHYQLGVCLAEDPGALQETMSTLSKYLEIGQDQQHIMVAKMLIQARSAPAASQKTPVRDDPSAIESDWQQALKVGNSEAFRSFLKQHPSVKSRYFDAFQGIVESFGDFVLNSAFFAVGRALKIANSETSFFMDISDSFGVERGMKVEFLCPKSLIRGMHLVVDLTLLEPSKILPREHSLFKAALTGDIVKVKAAIAEKININSADPKGHTALMFAAAEGHFEVVKYLLANGAQVETKDESGNTALIWAAALRHIDVVRLLVENKADVNAANASGSTVLNCAGDTVTANYLKSNGGKNVSTQGLARCPAAIFIYDGKQYYR